MERTLNVLDYAVLVISGTDGVQPHTLTLWRLLKRYNIPVFIFVNKIFSECKNYIIFYPTASGTGLNVVIGNDAEAQLPENPVEIGYDNISIKFSKSEVGGNYNVTVSTSETAKVEGS